MRLAIMLAVLLPGLLSGLVAKKLPLLQTVDKVDLKKYEGIWYQFAYIPNTFQPREAGLVTAEYAIHPKGYVTVKNTSYIDFEGSRVKKSIKGKAFIADKNTNSKLKVQFFWPFKGDYWIILLDQKSYKWAVVSDPSRKYLWILTRSPYLDKELYGTLLAEIKARHIDTARIEMTGRFE